MSKASAIVHLVRVVVMIKDEPTGIWLTVLKLEARDYIRAVCKPLASSLMQHKRRRLSAVENSGRRVAIARG